MQKIIQIHDFPGFYESYLNQMIDDEIESIFNTDDSDCNSNIPQQFYSANVDYKSIHEKQAKEYCEKWLEKFETETGIKLDASYESYTSPKYYNFESDRLFAYISDDSINSLFTASEADNYESLSRCIKDRFTSRDGFLSSYSNDLGEWLKKPVLTWDHNELGTLLDAIKSIHCDDEFETWDLMENFQCNGNLLNAVYEAIPQSFLDFADLQREHGKALDYDVFQETGQAFDPDSSEPMPPLRCKQTLELFASH